MAPMPPQQLGRQNMPQPQQQMTSPSGMQAAQPMPMGQERPQSPAETPTPMDDPLTPEVLERRFQALPPEKRRALIAAISPEVGEVMMMLFPASLGPMVMQAMQASPDDVDFNNPGDANEWSGMQSPGPTDFQPDYNEPRGGPHPMSPHHGQTMGQQATQPGSAEIGAPNLPEQRRNENPLARMRA
jgi:hypothetical protein